MRYYIHRRYLVIPVDSFTYDRNPMLNCIIVVGGKVQSRCTSFSNGKTVRPAFVSKLYLVVEKHHCPYRLAVLFLRQVLPKLLYTVKFIVLALVSVIHSCYSIIITIAIYSTNTQTCMLNFMKKKLEVF